MFDTQDRRSLLSLCHASGVWIGVELDEAKGKSDGEVKGTRLFTCPPSHGSVLRRTALTLIDGGAGTKMTVSNFGNEFRGLVAAKTAAAPARDTAGRIDVLASKAGNASNGLETSTFTVCARIRPVLGDEGDKADGFIVVAPENAPAPKTAAEYTERARVFTPKVSLKGVPELTSKSNEFDYCFGPDEDNETVFAQVGRPLANRAMLGQVGVVFACEAAALAFLRLLSPATPPGWLPAGPYS